MRVAVTGATGLVGRFVVKELSDRGCEVSALARSPERTQGFEECVGSIEWHYGDMADEDSLCALLANCNGLIHAAFDHIPDRFRGGEGDDPVRFWERNHSGTIRCIEIARHAAVERVVLFSSRAVFDGLKFVDAELHDDVRPRPNTHYGLLKYTNEQLSSLYDDIVICSLRPTGIYGLTWPCERTKWWSLLANHFSGHGNSSLDSSSRTEVHGGDVACAAFILLQAKEASVRGRAFNCSDIVVSDQWLVELVRRILQDGASLYPDNLSSPSPPQNTMDCSRLRSLGWNPGGFHRLWKTLIEIVDRAGLSDVYKTG